ncbi:MAG: hypothetical protein JOZ80_01305 [Acidobacteriaceae bacterium]|nr:hypothetical protein [Acidobacteriaceae bacterium]
MSNSNDRLQHTNNPASKRDPEDREVSVEHEGREKMLDKTLADSFPTSDPLSSIPDPAAEDSLTQSGNVTRLFGGLAPGTWVALSVGNTEIVATGETRDEAEQKARAAGHPNVSLTEVPPDSDAPLQSSTEAA